MNCLHHPELRAVTSIYSGHDWQRIGLCKECADAFPWPRYRALGTGLGPQAHAEAQEAKRYDEEYQDSKPHAKLRIYL